MRNERMSKLHLIDRIYKNLTALLSLSAVAFLFIIVLVLLNYSIPSFVVNGFNFFTTVLWNPRLDGVPVLVNGFKTMSGSSYGMLVFFSGTLISSTLALVIGVPASLATAIFLTQIAPRKVKGAVSFLVELIAGVPSVVLGFWGILVLGPFLLKSFEPFL
ncbi:MAG: phosphate ABC transporter permease subunit PstC, partial [Nitrososphaerota archaeon]|nr:phosphate ABC transporter permease subunit PstC [Nitrososphaerota archaeon]